MNTPLLMLVDPPELSAESAAEMLDFLYQLTNAFENQYSSQLRQCYHSAGPPEPDLVSDFNDDELPTF
jgi:hypothetical protein